DNMDNDTTNLGLSDDDDDDELSDDDLEYHLSPTSFFPEKAFLPLPSHLNKQHFTIPIIAIMVKKEIDLRINQASHSLDQIRLSLGLKSVMFRKSGSMIKSQKTQTRARWSIAAIEQTIRHHVHIYHSARQGLICLEASQSIMVKFPI